MNTLKKPIFLAIIFLLFFAFITGCTPAKSISLPTITSTITMILIPSATPTKTPIPTPTMDPTAVIFPFYGIWNNQDKNTNEIVKIEFLKNPSLDYPTITFYGRCHPDLCVWPGKYLTDWQDLADGTIEYEIKSYNGTELWAVREIKILLLPDNLLKVNIHHYYLDGREDRDSEEFFIKENVSQ